MIHRRSFLQSLGAAVLAGLLPVLPEVRRPSLAPLPPAPLTSFQAGDLIQINRGDFIELARIVQVNSSETVTVVRDVRRIYPFENGRFEGPVWVPDSLDTSIPQFAAKRWK